MNFIFSNNAHFNFKNKIWNFDTPIGPIAVPNTNGVFCIKTSEPQFELVHVLENLVCKYPRSTENHELSENK